MDKNCIAEAGLAVAIKAAMETCSALGAGQLDKVLPKPLPKQNITN